MFSSYLSGISLPGQVLSEQGKLVSFMHFCDTFMDTKDNPSDEKVKLPVSVFMQSWTTY